jgi:hypothetical protein
MQNLSGKPFFHPSCVDHLQETGLDFYSTIFNGLSQHNVILFTVFITEERGIMAIRLGDEAPNFTAETTQGTVNFHKSILVAEQHQYV